MIDGIIKADGTSRLARSVSDFKTRYPTYDAFAAALMAGTLPLDILFNAAGWSQMPDFLNKANLLKDSTAAKFGLGTRAVADDVFNFVGKYNQHWWARTAQEARTKYRYMISSAAAFPVRVFLAKVQCSSTIEFDENTGEVTLVNPVQPTAYIDILRNPYCKSTGNGIQNTVTGAYDNTDVFYLPNAASEYADGYYVSYDSDALIYKVVVESYSVNAGETDYVQSADRNTYPDSGINGGFEYQYLDVPFQNAVTASKVATGSYVGTGLYGSSNPTTISLPFDPKAIIIVTADAIPLCIPHLTTSFEIYHAAPLSGSSIISGYSKVRKNGNKVELYAWTGITPEASWYPKYQMNESGTTYHYIAIG